MARNLLITDGDHTEEPIVTANLSGKIDGRLKAWIEELLPERQEAEGGAEPLNLEELQHSLGTPKGRDAMKQHRSRAA